MNDDDIVGFPVDDFTLSALEASGEEFSLTQLLHFLSGYDPTNEVPWTDEDGIAIGVDFVENAGGEWVSAIWRPIEKGVS